jgi:predicted Zn-dependent protease with MMP-like domain
MSFEFQVYFSYFAQINQNRVPWRKETPFLFSEFSVAQFHCFVNHAGYTFCERHFTDIIAKRGIKILRLELSRTLDREPATASPYRELATASPFCGTITLMNKNNRDYFDQQVGWVLDRLPRKVLRILMDVPLHVEDQPSKYQIEEMEIDNPEELCGTYRGVTYCGGTWGLAGVSAPNSITIFRRGIVAASKNEQGKVSINELRRQIRITILHELAHLHGMDEDEIAEVGYG